MVCFFDHTSHRYNELLKTSLYINPKCHFCKIKASKIIHKKHPTTEEEIYDIHNILSVCEECHKKHKDKEL